MPYTEYCQQSSHCYCTTCNTTIHPRMARNRFYNNTRSIRCSTGRVRLIWTNLSLFHSCFDMCIFVRSPGINCCSNFFQLRKRSAANAATNSLCWLTFILCCCRDFSSHFFCRSLLQAGSAVLFLLAIYHSLIVLTQYDGTLTAITEVYRQLCYI